MDIVMASNNKGKIKEFKKILTKFNINLLSLGDIGFSDDIEETGETFLENARIKAVAVFKATNLPCLADDSGLCIDALGGRPGVLSARYGGASLTDLGRMELVLKEMLDVPDDKRSASFECALCLVFSEDDIIIASGECFGEIGRKMSGSGGFGYDPIFYIEDGRSMAQISDEEKNEISHRAVASRELLSSFENRFKKEEGK